MRLLSILVLVLCGSLALAVGSVPASAWRLDVREVCNFEPVSGAGVILTSRFTFSNARGGRSTSVRVLPGWNIGRLYPKAETAFFVRLAPGQTARRVVTRTIPSAPGLRAKLHAGGVNCASSFTYAIP